MSANDANDDPNPPSAAIETRDLTKTYPGGVRALDGLTFSVPRGAVFGLLGPNGAGKSTAIKILTTLSRPDSGEARVAGFNVLAEPQQVRRAIGCAFFWSGIRCSSRAWSRCHAFTSGFITRATSRLECWPAARGRW